MKYNFEVDLSKENSASLILKRIQPGTKILEFGPAAGYMTRYMKEELGCTVYGVEMDPEAAEIAKESCVKMIVGDIDEFRWVDELSNEVFDYIILADVLEHLKDPWKALKHAVDFLKKDGSVLTSIPNIGHNAVIMELLQDRFDYRPLGLLDDTHLRFFTKKTVLELLQKAGLHPVEWLAITVDPQFTEFKQQYESFPLSIQRTLKDRPDSHIYQFVTVSKKLEDIKSEEFWNECDIDNTGNSSLKDELQVFWQEKGQFSEICSVKAVLDFNNEFVTYDLRVPSQATGCLRLDPGTHSAYIEIKEISLYSGEPKSDFDDSALMRWSQDNKYSGVSPESGVIIIDDSPVYRLISIDNDPQILIKEIPSDFIAEYLTLRVIMRILEVIHSNVPKDINNSLLELKDKTVIVNQLNEKLSEADLKLKQGYDQVLSLQSALAEKDAHLNEQTKCVQALKGLLESERELVRTMQEKTLQKEEEIYRLINSFSWKITTPLRHIRAWMSRLNR